jgi:hypothetical protein
MLAARRSRVASLGVTLGAALALGGACQERREREVAARADADAYVIVLARTKRGLTPMRPEARVVVGPRAVGFDDAAWFRALAPDERDRLREAARAAGAAPPTFKPLLAPATADAIARGPAALAPLGEALRAEADWRRRARAPDADGLVANVRFDWETRFALVGLVLATVEGAGFKALPVLAGPGGEGVLSLSPDAAGERPCPTAAVRIGARGVAVSVEASTGAILAAPAADGGPPRRPAWQRLVVPRGGAACPAVPYKEGALDGRALTALLAEVAAALPACEVEVIRPAAAGARPPTIGTELGGHSEIALVAATADTRWRDVVAAADAAAAAGFPHARLRGPADEPPPASCDDAIPVAALRDRLSKP